MPPLLLLFIHPELGFMHVRTQSWLPLTVQNYINGREWLCRQLDRRSVGYERYDNPLLRIDDMATAERLARSLLRRRWPALLAAALLGTHFLNGFCNTDIAHLAYPTSSPSPQQNQRRRERISRLIAKLRGHGLTAKVPRSHPYRVTPLGKRVMAATLRFRQLDIPTAHQPAAGLARITQVSERNSISAGYAEFLGERFLRHPAQRSSSASFGRRC